MFFLIFFKILSPDPQDKESWVEEERLPLAVAGAATVCTGERMMMIGGVVEEDYYQDQSEARIM